jgi:hypothetical protein
VSGQVRVLNVPATPSLACSTLTGATLNGDAESQFFGAPYPFASFPALTTGHHHRHRRHRQRPLHRTAGTAEIDYWAAQIQLGSSSTDGELALVRFLGGSSGYFTRPDV